MDEFLGVDFKFSREVIALIGGEFGAGDDFDFGFGLSIGIFDRNFCFVFECAVANWT